MTVWTIEPVALHRVRGPEVLFQRAFAETVELAIHAFALRSGATVCLVDTGLAADYHALNRDVRLREGAESGFADVGARLPQLLGERGLQPELLLLTSFGPYAVGGLEAFPQVPLHVSARGCADLEQREEPALAHAVTPEVRERLLLVEGTALGAAEHAAHWHRMVRALGRRCAALIPIHDPQPVAVVRERWHRSLSGH